MSSSRRRGNPSRKVGLGRMDAALDAMRFMGFPSDLVRKLIKELLQVYGGDEGWLFIEEASYKVLIEAILDRQEQCEAEQSNNKQYLLEYKVQQPEKGDALSTQTPKDTIEQRNHDETPSKKLRIGDQSVQCPQSPSPHPSKLRHTSQEKLGIQVTSPSPVSSLPLALCNTSLEKLGIQVISSSPIAPFSLEFCNTSLETLRTQETSSTPAASQEKLRKQVTSPAQVSCLPRKRRKPCYGWISSDDDEEEDILTLTPAS